MSFAVCACVHVCVCPCVFVYRPVTFAARRLVIPPFMLFPAATLQHTEVTELAGRVELCGLTAGCLLIGIGRVCDHCSGMRARVCVCVAVTECLFGAWGYKRAGAAKVLWFCP